MKSWDDHLDLLIRARTPLIWIRSTEEERIEQLLEQAGNEMKRRWNRDNISLSPS